MPSPSDASPSTGRRSLFQGGGPTQACVPQSLDKNYAENRKPVELVPPSGTESKWCLCATSSSLSSPLPFLFCPSLHPLLFLPSNGAHQQHFTRQLPSKVAKAAVKIGFKITADSTPRFLPAQIRSVNLFCQINERSRLLSCSKSFRLGLPSWHLAGCRQGTGRVGRHWAAAQMKASWEKLSPAHEGYSKPGASGGGSTADSSPKLCPPVGPVEHMVMSAYWGASCPQAPLCRPDAWQSRAGFGRSLELGSSSHYTRHPNLFMCFII